MNKGIKVLVDQVQSTQQEMERSIVELKMLYPNWDNNTDLRRTVLTFCNKAVLNLGLSLRMIDTTLYSTRENWWTKFAPEFDQEYADKLTKFHNTTLSNTTFLVFFSLIESEIRQLSYYLFEDGSRVSVRPFKQVYEKVFKHLELPNHIDTFDFARYIRNCIHTNMHYMNSQLQDKKGVIFNGKSYDFLHGKLIPYDSKDCFLSIMKALFDSIVLTIKHPIIASIETIHSLY